MDNNFNLIKEKWSMGDIDNFQSYLISLSKGNEKSQWEQRICNTKLPCIAIPSNNVKEIIKQIAKGNFISFIDLWIWQTLTNTFIIGGLICKIKDFDTFKSYLLKYAERADNWATCDLLKFNINDNEQFYNLAIEFCNSRLPFARRIGISIFFKLINDNDYIDKILNFLNNFENEKEYYVNMIISWLLCDCFIKQKEKTLNFLNNNKLNNFTINKAIQKCRDSFRVTQEDKENLLKFKRLIKKNELKKI